MPDAGRGDQVQEVFLEEVRLQQTLKEQGDPAGLGKGALKKRQPTPTPPRQEKPTARDVTAIRLTGVGRPRARHPPARALLWPSTVPSHHAVTQTETSAWSAPKREASKVEEGTRS